MPPARTGSLEKLSRKDGRPYYRVRIRLADGSRVRVDVPEKYATAERVELYALAVQEREDERGELLAAKKARHAEGDASHGETCTAYRLRLNAKQASEGKWSVRREYPFWTKWIAPAIGARPIAEVTPEECENIRDRLDDEVRKRIAHGIPHGLSGGTALNVWSILRTTFKESVSSRDRTMRVRTSDPSAGLKPPLTTTSRKKTFVYPNEFAALMACDAVPLAWRQTYALAFYLYLRPGELRAATLGDVDLEADVVRITKAYDEETKETRQPKTANGVRDVPIEPALRPLLVALKERGQPSSLLAPWLAEVSEYRRAGAFLKHLRLAGISRPNIFTGSVTTMAVNFRSCRDSGITWLALKGVDLARIQRRAGHDKVDTTVGYVKQAEDLQGKVGTPFPPLPAELLGQRSGQPSVNSLKITRNIVGAAGLEPATSSV